MDFKLLYFYDSSFKTLNIQLTKYDVIQRWVCLLEDLEDHYIGLTNNIISHYLKYTYQVCCYSIHHLY